MADNNVVYMVGWCPDCGRTVVVRHEEEWTCGCGHDLLNLTSCFSPAQVADAVALMETVKNDALREPDAHRPTLAEEAANARAAAAALAEEETRCEDDGDDGAPDIIKELFCELFRDDCENCPLHRVGGDYDRVFRGLRRKYAKGGGAPLPEDMTPHTLRHTFCTEMAKAGMNPKALQYIMGHKDIKMTLGYYAHMDGCTAAEEMRRVAV